MKRRTILRGLATTLFAMLATWGTAQAAPVEISSGYGDNAIVMRSTFQVTDFIAATAGTVTLSVKDMQWGDLLSTLSTSVSLFGGQKLQLQGNSSVVFDIGASERFTTSIYAIATGGKGYGLYNLDIAFKTSAVPLPLGVWMLLAGTGLLGLRRRRSAQPPAVAAA